MWVTSTSVSTCFRPQRRSSGVFVEWVESCLPRPPKLAQVAVAPTDCEERTLKRM